MLLLLLGGVSVPRHCTPLQIGQRALHGQLPTRTAATEWCGVRCQLLVVQHTRVLAADMKKTSEMKANILGAFLLRAPPLTPAAAKKKVNKQKGKVRPIPPPARMLPAAMDDRAATVSTC